MEMDGFADEVYILLMIPYRIISNYLHAELLDDWDNDRCDGRFWNQIVTEIPP